MTPARVASPHAVPGLTAGLVCAALCLALPWFAGANPLPPTAIFTHVQAPDPTFCDQSPLMHCAQIVQYTEATGVLEFDLFVWTFFAGQQLDAVQLTAEWPAEWGFVEGSLCNGAHGTMNVQGHRAVINASWAPDCPTMETEVLLFGKILLNVTDRGEFGYSYSGPHTLTWGCPPNEWTEELAAFVGAEAGIECSHCYTDCGFDMVCLPEMTPHTLAVELPQGQIGEYGIDVTVWMWEQPCPINFIPTESWMALGVEQLDWEHYRVSLTVDTSGMEPGEYSGWVRGESDCVDCCRVVLTVLDSQGIEEEPVEKEDLPGTVGSWGRVKNLYR
jgi:hypothetical protein